MLLFLLLLAGCGEAVAPSAPPGVLPHFVRWAPSGSPRFSAVVGGTGQASVLSSVAGLPAPEGLGTSWAGRTSQLTWHHPVGVSANRLLVVGLSIKDPGTAVTGVTGGGVPLTFLGASSSDNASARIELWYLTAPASGWLPIQVSLSRTADVIGGATTFSGVDQALPLGGFVGNGSTGPGATDPSVVLTNAQGGLALTALAVASNPGALTTAPGLAQSWIGFPDRGHKVTAATAPGADSVALSWSKTSNAKWAIAAVAIRPAPWTGPPLDQFRVSFWAVRGQRRTTQINYQEMVGGIPQPFLRLDVTDPVYVPGRPNLAPGDSVLLSVTVDPVSILVQLEPSGVQFGQPATLHLWYGGAGGDLNGDGTVDNVDADIESRLKLVYQEGPADPWTGIPAAQSAIDMTFTADLPHFSNYAVAY